MESLQIEKVTRKIPGLKNGNFYQKVGIDIESGQIIPSETQIIAYDGKFDQAMPNVRLKGVPTNDELKNWVSPSAMGQPEGIAWTFYDTQSYTSTTTTQLDFFQTVQTDVVLGNMRAAGQLPNPMWFQLYHIGIYFQIPPVLIAVSTGTTIVPATGALNDVRQLLNGVFTLSIADKIYYQAKIGMAPAGYGPNPSQAVAGTFGSTSAFTLDYAQNGVPDLRNRNCFWGTIIVPPTQNFIVRMNWTTALTLLVTSPCPIVANLDGYLFRRVL